MTSLHFTPGRGGVRLERGHAGDGPDVLVLLLFRNADRPRLLHHHVQHGGRGREFRDGIGKVQLREDGGRAPDLVHHEAQTRAGAPRVA